MAERKLFGTDGVRGVVGEKLTAELACGARAGRSTRALRTPSARRCLIIRDTRESGPMLEAALAAGIAAAGGDALLAACCRRPRPRSSSAGSASTSRRSSRPPTTPGATTGSSSSTADGLKLDDADEAGSRSACSRPTRAGRPAARRAPCARSRAPLDDYLRELAGAFRLDLAGLRVVLDCANGATHRAAPAIFERLGAEVEAIGAEPDGRNINEGCGSTHPEALARARRGRRGATIGFAFDGDGDRVIAVDGERHASATATS